jgi:hypothetical protein
MKIYNTRKSNESKCEDIDLELPEILQKTIKGDNFILFDSGSTTANRIQIFGTKTNLLHMRNSKVFLGDGTFRMCLKNYYQIYTVHFTLNHHVLPGLYCFVSGKSLDDYTKLFVAVKKLLLDYQPDCFIVDHEVAAMKAFKSVYPAVEIKLCMFHLGQTFWKKIQELGLSSEYKKYKV